MKTLSPWNRFGRRLRATLSVTLLVCGAGLFATPTHAALADDLTTTSLNAIHCDNTGSDGHTFYLNTAQGPVNVTNSMYTVSGQTYITYNGTNIPVVLNYTNDNIYNLSGGIIGYITTASP